MRRDVESCSPSKSHEQVPPRPAVEVAFEKSISPLSFDKNVTNLPRSVEFYVKTFDGTITFQDAESVRVKCGKTGNDHIALRVGNPPGKVDHIALGVKQFNKDAVTATL